MNQQELEDVLETGNAGECLGGHGSVSFNGALIWAVRYLQAGTDTIKVMNSGVGFANWPKDEFDPTLPDSWWMMPKGLLLAYFKWYEKEKDLKLGEFKNL